MAGKPLTVFDPNKQLHRDDYKKLINGDTNLSFVYVVEHPYTNLLQMMESRIQQHLK